MIEIYRQLDDLLRSVIKHLPLAYDQLLKGWGELVAVGSVFLGLPPHVAKWIYEQVVKMFAALYEMIKALLEYINEFLLPWLFAPLEFGSSATRFSEVANTYASIGGELNVESWTHSDYNWKGGGKVAYDAVVTQQVAAVKAATNMAAGLNKTLRTVSVNSCKFGITCFDEMTGVTQGLVTGLVKMGSIEAVFKGGKEIAEFVNVAFTALRKLVTAYMGLIVDAAGHGDTLMETYREGLALPGDAWPVVESHGGRPSGGSGWSNPPK